MSRLDEILLRVFDEGFDQSRPDTEVTPKAKTDIQGLFKQYAIKNKRIVPNDGDDDIDTYLDYNDFIEWVNGL